MRKILSFLTLFLVPALAAAQSSRFEITPFAGYRLAGDFNAPNRDSVLTLGAEVDESAIYGVTRIDPQFSELSAENRVSGSLGGGVKILFSQNVGVRFEGRGYWTDLDTRFNDRYSRYDSNDGLYQTEASAGLIFRF